ncbi:MAG: PBP1A family penicillin-binding protein [Acidobacteria bacterium]|nr:PBP1A family penicillin-binding protein [Acidobacteriota bacterium]
MKTRPSGRGSKKRSFKARLADGSIRFIKSPAGKILGGLTLAIVLAGGVAFNHYWWKYSKLVDARLAGGPFNRASKVLAAPDPIFVGQDLDAEAILARLREAGYSDSQHNAVGRYIVKDNAVEVYPGPLSYFAQEPAVLYFEGGKIARVVSLNDNTPQTAYELEPELITHLFDDNRNKRRIFKFEDFPPVLIKAVVAIEDHRFYSHYGIDIIRFSKAAFDGLVQWEKPRGTSTLTQQLARNFFLTPEVSVERKAAEMLIAFQLETRLDKDQIFEHYANQVNMGRSGSFNVMGMGEGARAYFDKDVRDVTLAEAALLAGLPQGPSYLNPYRHPDRAKNRRAQVLRAMLREGFIDQAQFDQANAEELHLAQGHIESSAAPYYVDLVNTALQEHFNSDELISSDYWVYTTLDKNLQRAAVEAVRIGMEQVDEQIAKQRRWKGKEAPRAQAALVALDPHTGEVKAIVGGRDYGESQLNRVLAKRQPGSVFKPFVYAAALEKGYTASTLVDDVPTTFWYENEPYEPANFMNKIYGLITFREALRKSINIATVKVAEMAGYRNVYDLAKRADLGDSLRPTPSLSLGSYEATPLQVAGAYTTFVNGGVMKKPYFVRLVRDSAGNELLRREPVNVEVMDKRVSYIVTNMLEDVMLHGTAAGARYRYKFTEPAAGKTGTDDDGWFAGFTDNLLCVVWVGFDDNTDLSLEGARSALPIWAEFMKRAHEQRPYRNPAPFERPEGVVSVSLDADTYELATSSCTNVVNEVFIAGTEPTHYCSLHSGGGFSLATSTAGWDADSGQDPLPVDRPVVSAAEGVGGAPRIAPAAPAVGGQPITVALPEAPAKPTAADDDDEQKNGVLKKVFGIFKKK